MTKLVLDSKQAPCLKDKVSGDMVVLKVYAIVEGNTTTEGGYTQYILDVKGIEDTGKAESVEEAGERALTELKNKSVVGVYPG